MNAPHYHYFIELPPHGEIRLPRARETEARRELAGNFIATMREWLQENGLGGKVSALGVTLFGQVQITCDPAVINVIRNQDVIDIAAIRQGTATYAAHMSR